MEEEIDYNKEVMYDVYDIIQNKPSSLDAKFFTKKRRDELLNGMIKYFETNGDTTKLVNLYSMLLGPDDDVY